jgi:methyl halide transferase
VTAVDLSRRAIRRARELSIKKNVSVEFRISDVTRDESLVGPYDFVFDRGCYHAVRLADAAGYLRTLERVTRPGSVGLVLTGNAAEPEDDAGPPVVAARDLRAEFGRRFEIIHLRPFRFDPRRVGEKRYLGWSCFWRRP